MRELKDYSLQRTLPSSIADDKNVKNIVKAIEPELRKINAFAELILLLPRLDELSEDIVDVLAWQYHVDFYDYEADVSIKRNLVRNALAWHKIKGTPAAVEAVVGTVFTSGRVFEWWEYDAEPYHFEVRLIEEPCPNPSVIEKLIRAIQETKNTRSWCDGLYFSRRIEGTIVLNMMGSSFKKVSIYPAKFDLPDTEGSIYIGGGMTGFRKTEIRPKVFEMEDTELKAYAQGRMTLWRKTEVLQKGGD